MSGAISSLELSALTCAAVLRGPRAASRVQGQVDGRSRNGRWQYGEGGMGDEFGSGYPSAPENLIQNLVLVGNVAQETSPHLFLHGCRACFTQTASVLHKAYFYIFPDRGDSLVFPFVQPRQSHPTSTSPLQIRALSLRWSSEYFSGVNLNTVGTILLQRASGWGIQTQPQWLHYSSVAWPTGA